MTPLDLATLALDAVDNALIGRPPLPCPLLPPVTDDPLHQVAQLLHAIALAVPQLDEDRLESVALRIDDVATGLGLYAEGDEVGVDSALTDALYALCLCRGGLS